MAPYIRNGPFCWRFLRYELMVFDVLEGVRFNMKMSFLQEEYESFDTPLARETILPEKYELCGISLQGDT